jgi:hypothetical protein
MSRLFFAAVALLALAAPSLASECSIRVKVVRPVVVVARPAVVVIR